MIRLVFYAGMSNLAQNNEPGRVIVKSAGRWVAHGTRSSTTARSLSQTACGARCIRFESVRFGYAGASRFRSAKDVPILRVNHAAGADVLPGVREIACSSDKVNELPGAQSSETLK